MKKYLLALALLPALASAENYFTEGTVWNYLGLASAIGEESFGITTYSLEGTQTVGGYECSNLYRVHDHNPATRTFVALIRTEGDKVLFLRSEEDTEWLTLYDFSLTLGESVLVTPIYAGGWNDTNYVECISEGVAEKYGDFPKINILGKDEISDRTREEWSDSYLNMWLRGVGGTSRLDIDVAYDGICGYSYDTLLNVTANGTTVCQHSDYRDVEEGESVFLPSYIMWCSEIFGDESPAIKTERYMQTIESFVSEPSKPRIITNSLNKSLQKVSVEGDVVYRMNIGDQNLKVVAYDFAMQPGDVREVAPIEGELDETTWMRCEKRKPSTVFPGHDEIFLAEFADEAMTQFLGRGSWIAGIGTIHGVSCNSRFDRSMANHQLCRIIVNGRVAFERSLAGIGSVVEAQKNFEVRTAGRYVMADEPFALYTTDGRLISSGTTTVEVTTPGIYVAASQSGAAKVAVK